MEIIDVVQRLTATSSRLEKEAILTEAFKGGQFRFFEGMKLACDPLISFGVKKVALIEDESDPSTSLSEHESFQQFLDLAAKLKKRELTGHAARDAIHALAEKCNSSIWNLFYRRILLKDLKMGIDESTVNKVLTTIAKSDKIAENYVIPVFSCQLAHDGEKPEHQKKVKGKKLLDIKLDGVRLLTVLDKESGTVTQFTRNGKLNENFVHIRESLLKLMEQLPGSVVLDGEIVGANFQELMTQVNRQSNVDTKTAKLALFDMIPLPAFKAGTCKTSQKDRHDMLTLLETSGALSEHTGGSVYVIPKIEVDLDTPEGQTAFADFNKAAIAAAYEGVMIKDPEAPYVTKRSAAWLKKKPVADFTLEIVGFEEGKPDSKYVGMLGAIVCRGEDDGRVIETNVGSGFSDEQRVELWSKRENLIGMLVEIRADTMTQERGSDVWSLRFPRFKGFRGSVPGEKI